MSENHRDPTSTKTVKVPVKRVGNRWEFFYGGEVPAKEGALGELSLSVDQIADAEFLHRVTATAEFKVLEEGTTLLVALSVRGKADPYAGYEFKHFPRGIPIGTTHWEEIRLGPPKKRKIPTDPQQELLTETGGLWLKLKGLERCELSSSSIAMPDGFDPTNAISLNHAYTLLSRQYETHRISNTGNVYDRVFYQDHDKCWYPIDDLRRGVRVKAERSLMHELWAQIEQMLGWRPLPATKKGRR